MTEILHNLAWLYIELLKYNYTVKSISKNPVCIILLSPNGSSESWWPIQNDVAVGFL